jgi:hypothetical protein
MLRGSKFRERKGSSKVWSVVLTPCVRSRSSQSHSLLYPYPLSERALTVRGARITSCIPIAVSTRSSNVKLPFRAMADFARAIHSQALAPNRESDIGGAIRTAACPSLRRTASLTNAVPEPLAALTLLGPLFSQMVSGAPVGGNPPNW